MAGSLLYYAIQESLFYLLYPTISAITLTCAYWIKNPKLIAGKDENGNINWIIFLINFPWLIITYSVWLVQFWLSRENKCDRITNNIDIGCYPIDMRNCEYDIVIDLTSEFPKPRNILCEYHCYPNLDGIALVNINIPLGITKTSKIFIHCAQGHGRSATYCSFLLLKLGLVEKGLTALDLILKKRPYAKPSNEQIFQIKYA